MDSTEWEPEVPGQFSTPLRIRRQRDEAEAAHSITATPAATDYVCIFILLMRLRG